MNMMLRRYHDTPKVAEVVVEAGPTPTHEEAATAAEAHEAQVAAEQAEQAQRAAEAGATDAEVNDAIQAQTPTDSEGAIVVPDSDSGSVPDHPKRNASTQAWRDHIATLPEDQRPEGWETASRDEMASAILGPVE